MAHEHPILALLREITKGRQGESRHDGAAVTWWDSTVVGLYISDVGDRYIVEHLPDGAQLWVMLDIIPKSEDQAPAITRIRHALGWQ